MTEVVSEGGYRDAFRRVRLYRDKTNPRRLAYLLLLLLGTPPDWPWMLLGTVLALAGIGLHGWAAGYLARAGYSDRETVLTLRGPYRHNRNPYYVAHMVMDLGMFCVAGLAPYFLLYFPVIFVVYRRWIRNEEAFLEEAFGADYDRMRTEVPRWGFRLTPAPGRGPEQRFTWAMYRFNGEHWRSGSHLLCLGVFWMYWLSGNPFAALPPLAAGTTAGVMAVYLLLHDVRPREVWPPSAAWMAFAVTVTLTGVAVLATAPVWQTWDEPWLWLGRVGGLALCAWVAVAAIRSRTRATAPPPEPFRVFLVAWYVAVLAAGLITATTGGVWLAMIASMTVWACTIAGAFPLSAAPAAP